jgi:hypothetical protein
MIEPAFGNPIAWQKPHVCCILRQYIQQPKPVRLEEAQKIGVQAPPNLVFNKAGEVIVRPYERET